MPFLGSVRGFLPRAGVVRRSDDPCDLAYHLGHQYTAVFYTTGQLVASLYNDGAYASDLATLTASDALLSLIGAGYIYGDGLVADHSLVWFATGSPPKFLSWDIDLNTLYQLSLPANTTNFIGWGYNGGWVYYVTKNSSTLWVLRKVRPDMTGDVAVSTLAYQETGSADPLAFISASNMNIPVINSGDNRIVTLPLDGSAGDQGSARLGTQQQPVSLVSYLVGAAGRQLVSPGTGSDYDLKEIGDTGDQILHYPVPWTGGPAFLGTSAPTPDRSAWTAYRSDTGEIFRWPIATDPDGSCPAPLIEAELHLAAFPTVMLPRN